MPFHQSLYRARTAGELEIATRRLLPACSPYLHMTFGFWHSAFILILKKRRHPLGPVPASLAVVAGDQ
eukprot:scaffold75461_cov28-Prasinocladus_malaysianus.AAC.1